MTTRAQIGFWLGGLIIFGILLFLLHDILLPFVAGMAVAYVLDPVADRLEAAGLSRTMATVLITILFFVLTIGALFLLLPIIYQQVIDLVSRVPAITDSIRDYLLALTETVFASLEEDQLEGAREALAGYSDGLVAWILGLGKGVWRSGLALVNLVALIFITPIVTFYLLRDWDHIVARADNLLPRRHAAEIRAQLSKINAALAGFVRGQGLICGILMAYYGISLTLVGLDFGLVVGLGAGSLSFIPYVGAIVGFVTAVTLALLQFDDLLWVGAVAMVFVVGQVVEGNFLSPKLVGEQVGLHPVWIIFGALAGATLFGLVGMLMAVPATAVTGVLVRYAAEHYQASPVYLGTGRDVDDGVREDDGGGEPPS